MKNEKMFGLIQFIKFGVVGVANTGVDWVVFYILVNTFLSGYHSWAKGVSFVVAVLNSYIFNTIWTFKKEYDKIGKDQGAKAGVFLKFIVVSLIGWGINLFVFDYTFSRLGFSLINEDFVPLVLASGAAILWNFFANKLWTYKK
jgi:putative flippase GtrA